MKFTLGSEEIEIADVESIGISEGDDVPTRVRITLSGGREMNVTALTPDAKAKLRKQYDSYFELKFPRKTEG